MKRENLSFRILIISALVCGFALVYFFADARYPGFFPVCPFFALTGLHCPGCGSQRAVSSLLHGDFIRAVHYNVMFVASLPLVLYSASVSLFNLFRSDTVVQKIFYSPIFAKAVLVIVVLFWIARNIPVYPFTVLAPLV